MMSYNVLNTCWPYGIYMAVQGRVEIASTDHESKVYKVDYLVQSSLSSSLVLPNTRLPLNPTLRVLSYNNMDIRAGVIIMCILYIQDSNLAETPCQVLLCFSPLDCLTENFTACVIIGPCVQWLLQQQNSTTSRNSALHGLLFLLFYYPRLRVVCSTSRRI